MCNAFSGIILRNKKVFWKLGIDGHEGIKNYYKLKDDENYCPFEITPENGDYVNPDEWKFKFDDKMPDWWKSSYERECFFAKNKWYKSLRNKFYIKRLNNLVNPFNFPLVKKPLKKHIKLLKKWVSVRYSVRDSVWDSVWDSIGDSVWNSVRNSIGNSIRDSVWNSVGDSIRDSVWDSVYAYIGSCFRLSRKEWKYTEKIKCGNEYPFIPLIKLWNDGLVPSFDGIHWRLHSGKKAKIVFKISKKKLEKYK